MLIFVTGYMIKLSVFGYLLAGQSLCSAELNVEKVETGMNK